LPLVRRTRVSGGVARTGRSRCVIQPAIGSSPVSGAPYHPGADLERGSRWLCVAPDRPPTQRHHSTPAPLASWVTATSYFPSTKSAAEGPALKEFYGQSAPAAKALREIAPNARILTPSAALTQVRGQIVADAVNQVLFGQLTPDAGVKKMKAEADKAVREAL